MDEITVKECEILPNVENNHYSSTSQGSIENSSSSDEKLFKDCDVLDLGNTLHYEQQTSPAAREVLDELELRLVDDDYVKWRTNASAHPRNWTVARKTYDTGLVLLLDLFTWVTRT